MGIPLSCVFQSIADTRIGRVISKISRLGPGCIKSSVWFYRTLDVVKGNQLHQQPQAKVCSNERPDFQVIDKMMAQLKTWNGRPHILLIQQRTLLLFQRERILHIDILGRYWTLLSQITMDSLILVYSS